MPDTRARFLTLENTLTVVGRLSTRSSAHPVKSSPPQPHPTWAHHAARRSSLAQHAPRPVAPSSRRKSEHHATLLLLLLLPPLLPLALASTPSHLWAGVGWDGVGVGGRPEGQAGRRGGKFGWAVVGCTCKARVVWGGVSGEGGRLAGRASAGQASGLVMLLGAGRPVETGHRTPPGGHPATPVTARAAPTALTQAAPACAWRGQ